jgi:hypothetical protein
LRPTLEPMQMRAREAAAQLREAQEAEPPLKQEIVSLEAALAHARGKHMGSATIRVVQAESGPAIDRELRAAMAIQSDLIARRAKLRALHRAGCVGAEIEPAVNEFLKHNGDVLPGTTGSTEFEPERFDEMARETVHDVLERMRTDPDAASPL